MWLYVKRERETEQWRKKLKERDRETKREIRIYHFDLKIPSLEANHSIFDLASENMCCIYQVMSDWLSKC